MRHRDIEKFQELQLKYNRRKRRPDRGASLIEAALGALVLIPIALLIVDLMCLVFANSVNDTAAKNCARAGANQPNGAAAAAAAQKALATFQKSGIVKSIVIDDLEYQGEGANCICKTTMEVKLPVPFPGLSGATFSNRATEPIVGTADPTSPK